MGIDFGIDFLLAACLMEEDEREAIQQVVEDKFQVGEKFDSASDGEEQNAVEGEDAEDLLDDGVSLDPGEYGMPSDTGAVVSDGKVSTICNDLMDVFMSDDSDSFEHLLVNEEQVAQQTEFPCPECGKMFRSKQNMRGHFVDIHQPGEFPCPGCGKVFSSKNKQTSHFSRYCKPNLHKFK